MKMAHRRRGWRASRLGQTRPGWMFPVRPASSPCLYCPNKGRIHPRSRLRRRYGGREFGRRDACTTNPIRMKFPASPHLVVRASRLHLQKIPRLRHDSIPAWGRDIQPRDVERPGMRASSSDWGARGRSASLTRRVLMRVLRKTCASMSYSDVVTADAART